MSRFNGDNETLHALTPISGTIAPAASTTPSTADVPIDPLLLHSDFFPARQLDGSLVPQEIFEVHLLTIRKREPLRAACSHFEIRFASRANLEFLRKALVRHWYPVRATTNPAPAVHAVPGPSKGLSIVIPSRPPQPAQSLGLPNSRTDQETFEADLDVDDDTLAKEYDVGEGIAELVFGALDTGGLEDEDEDEELEDMDDLDDDATYKRFQTSVRVSAAQRTEANRRAGGRKTQRSVVRSWNVFQKDALAAGKLRDDIVDEHALLLFINFCAGRCKRNRRGEYIPNTRIGASQIKKEFFGALRIRKVQDARDPTLATKRPSTTVHVYDAVKTRMDEALQNAREGLIPAEDAPDIIANTFLAQLSDETLTRIRYVKPTINGHLAWTMMNASGNRGDDIRALRLCEMQPYHFLHPNGETSIPAVLGLQSDMEQKARSKGMKTTINPTYTCFIAHRNPEMCPLGAFALYLHYIHDVADVDSKHKVDYTVNKSWRGLRLIHGSSATVQYNETALQNLFVQSYRKAGVESNLKAHLARHMLGYHQEKMGVRVEETSKLGWSRDTYQNTYAPALPKSAILGAHGYKVHETYSPPWTQVKVPEPFLGLVCPMAEKNIELVKGLKDRVGTTNYWEMVVWLRPYLFQVCPCHELDIGFVSLSLVYVWDCYNIGEGVEKNGRQTGVKPPLRLVEQKFGSEWRKAEKNRKAWQRFREIPEWIDIKIKNGFTVSQAIAKLEEVRSVPGKSRLLGTSGLAELLAAERKAAAKALKDRDDLASNGTAGSVDSGEATSITGSKRRAPTVGGRPKPKKERRS